MTPVLNARRLADSEHLPEHLDRLYRAAWAMCGSPHDAEDLVQETFARVLARPRALRRGDPLPYLMGALRKTYLTGLRTSSRRLQPTALPADESSEMRSSLARPEAAAEQHEALAAIAALPEDFRAALVAVDIIGLSYREAARTLGVREATITTRLFRARQRLARTLSAERWPTDIAHTGHHIKMADPGEARAAAYPTAQAGRATPSTTRSTTPSMNRGSSGSPVTSRRK